MPGCIILAGAAGCGAFLGVGGYKSDGVQADAVGQRISGDEKAGRDAIFQCFNCKADGGFDVAASAAGATTPVAHAPGSDATYCVRGSWPAPTWAAPLPCRAGPLRSMI